MGDILTRIIATALWVVNALPHPPAAHPPAPAELREERIHLVTVVFPAAAPQSRAIVAPEGERMTFVVDARTYGAWQEGEDLVDGDLRWLRPRGELEGRRAVVGAKEVRRRCFRMRGEVERVAVPVAECDWYRYAPAEAGYAVETVSYGEVERIIAYRVAPCVPRPGSPLERRFVTVRTADAPMSSDLRKWSGGALLAGQLTIETSPAVADRAGKTWDATSAAASWPYAGPLSEFVGGLVLTWTETDDAYATCAGPDGRAHTFPSP
ncbi:MAG: hypothetical protein RL272_1055 [Candidatus Parcubacteria bacterium]